MGLVYRCYRSYRSLGEAPLQDRDCIDVNDDENVIRPKLIQWNPAKKRTAPERDAYVGAKRVAVKIAVR
jgi:hypothetical protein